MNKIKKLIIAIIIINIYKEDKKNLLNNHNININNNNINMIIIKISSNIKKIISKMKIIRINFNNNNNYNNKITIKINKIMKINNFYQMNKISRVLDLLKIRMSSKMGMEN